MYFRTEKNVADSASISDDLFHVVSCLFTYLLLYKVTLFLSISSVASCNHTHFVKNWHALLAELFHVISFITFSNPKEYRPDCLHQNSNY